MFCSVAPVPPCIVVFKVKPPERWQRGPRPVRSAVHASLLGPALAYNASIGMLLAFAGVVVSGHGFFSFDLFRSVLERTNMPPGEVTFWIGMTSLLQNAGAFFGIYAFTHLTQKIGRRPAFALAFVAAMFSTAYTFWNLNDFTDIFWMIPLMGFCQLALFGGYAIYLRSCPTACAPHLLCYTRTVRAGVVPLALGLLTSLVYRGTPSRSYAGVTRSGVPDRLATVPFMPSERTSLPE